MSAFYKPALTEVNETYETANSAGIDVDKLDGSFLFGGFLGYHLSTNLGLRIQVTHWSEEASINPTTPGIIDPRTRAPRRQNQEIQVRTLMFDGQYYVGQPRSSIRVYLGAGLGIVFIKDKTSFESFDGVVQSGEQTFLEFGFRPFIGADFFSASKITFFMEAGYLISNYPVTTATWEPTTDNAFILTIREVDTSLNGLNATVGVKLNL